MLSNEQIWSLAYKGDASILSDDRVCTLRSYYNETPLHILGYKGVKEVATHPACISVRNDPFQETPLHILSITGSTSVLENQYCSSIFDLDGFTPLHILANVGVKKVLSHPDCSKVHTQNKLKRTPLHLIAYKNFKDVIKHPDVASVFDSKGWSPLHILAYHATSDTVRELMKHPMIARVREKDLGETPLHFLGRGKFLDILELDETFTAKDGDNWVPFQTLVNNKMIRIKDLRQRLIRIPEYLNDDSIISDSGDVSANYLLGYVIKRGV